MRLFMATLSTETNTFSPVPTAMSGFEAYYLRHGTATQEPPNLMTEALHEWRYRGEALGWEVVESLAAIAEPAGITTAKCYEALCAEILSDLEAAGGADIILLQLHGAMVAEGFDDCEGDITNRIRAMCPKAVIGISLDLHCHLTDAMMQACDLIICFKEYPHDDAAARAAELFDLARRTFIGELKPVMRCQPCQMINMYLTKTGAMRTFVDRMSKLEEELGLLSISLAHGFPFADVADVGAKVLVVTNGDPDLARCTARLLSKEFFTIRDEVSCHTVSLDEALDQATAHPQGPVVIADMGDNSGGGAPGDATFVLRALQERELENIASGIYWDPMVVRTCEDAGEGATLRLRLGGKTSSASGAPIDITATVMRIRSGLGQHLGKGREPLGTMVWLRCSGDLDIVVNDLRTQVYHPEAFEQMGIDLSAKSIVTVKSLFHFYAPFEKIASKIIQAGTPGGTSPDFQNIAYTKLESKFWPKSQISL
ncbi:M81 family metallopeptidase [Roseovarius rhodophyticola]|uniref:Microcystinase C n=1 Tax=Roseovarius rhodophyticola TaxID=3080827 RepID=A0ABZ2TFZ8_9RHOB|nr:M81 family metallopeptidase [Roseovarius sp. W115]